MHKLKLLFTVLITGFFLLPLMSASAQTANIKTNPVYPAQLGTVPAGTNPVYNGMKTVAKGMPVFVTADTTGGVTSFAWTLTGPTGTKTTLSSTTAQNVSFVPDTTGWYIVGLTVNGGSTDADTFWVSTYNGVAGKTSLSCQTCHSTQYLGWQNTGHAMIFKEGITGELEASAVDGVMKGVYSYSRCVKCHTTGFDQSANNGNFGYMAHQSGFDTAFTNMYPLVNGENEIPQGDQGAWNLLNSSQYSNLLATSVIGCESCHGPAAGHIAAVTSGDINGALSKINVSLDASVCLACHDAPPHHTIGQYYLASNHATMPLAGTHATSTSCFPCHSGTAYLKYTQNQTNPGYSSADASQPISCAACHDPHVAANFGLRIVPVTLVNNYSVPTGVGGNGQLCMNCHHSRFDASTIGVTAPYYGFTNRFGPHHGPQADMYLGRNAYEYGNKGLTGLMTHGSVTDACVTCHMANIGSGNSPSHQWSMVDTTGGTPHDLVGACVNCHGPITSFDDIKASSDWDGNGVVEGVQTEVEGMLNELAAYLPKDASGNVVSMSADSLKVKNQPAIVEGIFTYYFVTEDKSMGVHNAKYTVGILQEALKSLGSVVPVELTSFTASASANQVKLAWETATETNNKGFEVQKLVDGSWTTVGFINGNGTSTQISKYSYVDNLTNVSSGTITYRLRQIDYNGKANLSKEVEVNFLAGPKDYSLSQNYPNPFNPSTTISYALPYESNVKLVVYNITGAVVKVLVSGVQSAGTHQAVMNTVTNGSDLSSGIYFYSLQATSMDGSKSFVQTKKMILMK